MEDYVAGPRHSGQKPAVIPDGYFRLTGPQGTTAFALELDRGTVEEKPFKTTIRALGEWKLSGQYAKRFGTERLRVLFVVAPNERDPHRVGRIKRWSEAEGARSLFWLADLRYINENTVLDKPIWQVAGREGSHTLLY